MTIKELADEVRQTMINNGFPGVTGPLGAFGELDRELLNLAIRSGRLIGNLRIMPPYQAIYHWQEKEKAKLGDLLHAAIIHEENIVPSSPTAASLILLGEACEVAQAVLFNDNDNLKKELGDVLFAALHFAHARGYDPEELIRVTIEKNKARPYMHGRRW